MQTKFNLIVFLSVIFTVIFSTFIAFLPNPNFKQNRSFPITVCVNKDSQLPNHWKVAVKNGVTLFNKEIEKHSQVKNWIELKEFADCRYERGEFRIVDEVYFPFTIKPCKNYAYAFYMPSRKLIVICSGIYDVIWVMGNKLGRKEEMEKLRSSGREYVVMHEIGHIVFGLDHLKDPTCVMHERGYKKEFCKEEINFVKEKIKRINK